MLVCCLQLVSKVLVQERKRLIAAKQTYMRSEDTMREQVCLAEHSAEQGQAVTTQGFATLQVRAAAALDYCKVAVEWHMRHVVRDIPSLYTAADQSHGPAQSTENISRKQQQRTRYGQHYHCDDVIVSYHSGWK
jgi:hypothetical protein